MSKNNFKIGSDHDQCYFIEGNLHFVFHLINVIHCICKTDAI